MSAATVEMAAMVSVMRSERLWVSMFSGAEVRGTSTSEKSSSVDVVVFSRDVEEVTSVDFSLVDVGEVADVWSVELELLEMANVVRGAALSIFDVRGADESGAEWEAEGAVL